MSTKVTKKAMTREEEARQDQFKHVIEALVKNIGGRENFFRRSEPLPKDVIDFLRNLDQDDPLWGLFRGKRLFLGGSDIGSFMGCGKYDTVHQNHAKLRQDNPPNIDNVFTRYGHFGEDAVGQLSLESLCNLGGTDPRHARVNTIGTCVHSRVPFLAVSLDITYTASPESEWVRTAEICAFLGDKRGLNLNLVVGELKNPGSKSGQAVREVPSDYMAQSQFEVYTARHMEDPAFKDRKYIVLSILCSDVAKADYPRKRMTLGGGDWVLKQWLIKYTNKFMEWSLERVRRSIHLYEGRITKGEFEELPNGRIPSEFFPPNLRLSNYYVRYTGPREIDLSKPKHELEDLKAEFSPLLSPHNFADACSSLDERYARFEADLCAENEASAHA